MKEEFKKFARDHKVTSTMVEDYGKYIEKNIGGISNSITPMIVEERQLNATVISVFDRMMVDRILWVYGAVDSRMSSIVNAQLMYLDSLETKDIKLFIDSPGGSVAAGLSIVSMMDYVKSDICTTNMGTAASMGSVLLSSGTKGKRTSLLYSKVMTHMVSHGSQGNIQETRINQLEAEKYNYILFKRLSRNCSKSFDEIYEISRNDKWFNSDEALKMGLIDEIIGSENITISSELDGFEDYYKKEVLNKI